MNDITQLFPAIPEIFLSVATMALLLYGVFTETKLRRFIGHLSFITLLITLFLVLQQESQRIVIFHGLFVMDSFAIFMKTMILIGALLSILLCFSAIEREQSDRFELPILILFATLGMLMMVSANDFISLYISLEMQSLCLYILAAYRRDVIKSSEAGLKYFVLGALSSGLLLYGTSLLYGYTGTTNFDHLSGLITDTQTVSLGFIVGMTFIITGLAFKISAAPFHMWVPDVYEGSMTEVTAFFAIVTKLAPMALVLRLFFEPLGQVVELWQQIVFLIALVSMVVGTVTGIYQTNIKRLMAYSTIAHIGYALVGLAAGTQDGMKSVMIYMTLYLFMAAGIFSVLLCLRRKGRLIEDIGQMAGLFKTHPLMAIAATIFLGSMIGLPPLAGFFAKLYVFKAAVDAGLYILAVIGVVMSVVGSFYYIRLIKLMYFDDAPLEPFDAQKDDTRTIVMSIACLITLFFFVYPVPIVDSVSFVVM